MDDERPLSRRDLFRGRLLGRLADAAARRVDDAGRALARAMPADTPDRPVSLRVLPQRPPGAVEESAFMAGCTRCGECIVACPVQAIVIAPPTFMGASGTPMLDPENRACVMCADTPCIRACAPGVLRADRPLKMGTAAIAGMRCLAYNGSVCSACVDSCPVPGALVVEDARPRVVAPNCTGCGVCHQVCPAPSNAVSITALTERGG
jgi:ferredoxin-type protein NapG